ncbi:YbhB/YbcL family Raf kinase inhibitor-like protein [Patescibacteria group bacterium]|nr:YbhB/YbcL family Raf kinase inhibitor-like protein [Patescibacteria group bacterium]
MNSTSSTNSVFALTSPAFPSNGLIPAEYTCDGSQKNPPLVISNVPNEAQSLVLVMDDPDIPSVVKQSRGIDVFDHWVVFNIPATTTEIASGATVGTAGVNSSGGTGYVGPCPPPQYEPKEHRYIFTLYALREPLALSTGATKREVLDALAPHLLASAELIGRYARK